MATKKFFTDVSTDGTMESTSFVKTGGTSSQFLKADGSVDTTTYLSSTTGDWTGTFDGQQGTYYLNYNNLTNVPSTFAAAPHTLDSHSNVQITSNTSGEILKWNGTNWINNTLSEAGIAATGDIPTATSQLTNDSNFSTFDGAYSSLTGIPSTFAPSAHTLDSHSNVSISGNSAGEILKWNGSNWVNNTLSEAGIAASGDIPTATSDLTNDSGFISSTTGDWTGTFDGQEGSYYLDYNNFTNTPTITGVDGTGAANKVAFWTDADTLSNDTNLHWDSANDRLGIGQASPGYSLDVSGSIRTGGNYLGANSAYSYLAMANGNSHASIYTKTDTTAASNRFTVEGGAATTNAYFQNVKVGVGTTTPAGTFHIIGANTDSGLTTSALIIEQSDGAQIMIDGNDIDAVAGMLYLNDYSGNDIVMGGNLRNNSASGDSWFASSGNVGIGTTTPGEKLEVTGAIKLNSGAGDTIKFGTTSLTFEGGNDGSHDYSFGTSSAIYKSCTFYGATTRFGDSTNPSTITIDNVNGDLDADGDITAAKFVKTGGLSTEYLMADGSVSTGGSGVTGTGTSGYVAIWNGTTSLSLDTSLFFDSTNNQLGIGTTSPDYNLDVAGTIGVSSYIYHNDDTNTYIGFPSNDTFRITTSGGSRFTVDSAGHIGIGTSATTPASAFSTTNILELMSTGVAEIVLDHTDGGTTTDIGLLSFRRNNDQLGHFKAVHDGNTTNMRLGLHMQLAGGSFATSSSNEKFRWRANGDFHADGDVIAYSTTISDARLKDDIETIKNPNLLVKELRGVSYKWNSGSREGQKEIGLIAQEVEKVIPEIVREKEMISGETMKTVDYEKLVGLLIESNKELINKIEKLEKAVYNK